MSKRCPFCNISIDDRCTVCPACGKKLPPRNSTGGQGTSSQTGTAPKAQTGSAAAKSQAGTTQAQPTPPPQPESQAAAASSFTGNVLMALLLAAVNLALLVPLLLTLPMNTIALGIAAALLVITLVRSLTKAKNGLPAGDMAFAYFVTDLLVLATVNWNGLLIFVDSERSLFRGDGMDLVLALVLFAVCHVAINKFNQLPKAVYMVPMFILLWGLSLSFYGVPSTDFEVLMVSMPVMYAFLFSLVWFLTFSLRSAVRGSWNHPVVWQLVCGALSLLLQFSWCYFSISLPFASAPSLLQLVLLVFFCCAGALLMRRDEQIHRGDLVVIMSCAEIALLLAVGFTSLKSIYTIPAVLLMGLASYRIATQEYRGGQQLLPMPNLVSSLLCTGVLLVLLLLLSAGLWAFSLVLLTLALAVLFLYSKGNLTLDPPPILVGITLLSFSFLYHMGLPPVKVVCAALLFLFAMVSAIFANWPRADGSRPQKAAVQGGFCLAHLALNLLLCLL